MGSCDVCTDAFVVDDACSDLAADGLDDEDDTDNELEDIKAVEAPEFGPASATFLEM